MTIKSRRHFLQSFAAIPMATSVMKLRDLSTIADALGSTEKMPVLFLGHGTPMNAIEENEFVSGFREIGTRIQTPRAILCVSAHWETRGTYVTAMEHPRTIHDFGGFPKALFDVQYPAPGSPSLAHETADVVKKTVVGMDDSWGLDHGAWSVIKHLYPKANIPVVQLSLDQGQGPQYHYDLAKELSSLRSKGVLIVGSGNMVHNLRLAEWDKLNVEFGFDWALEARERMKHMILTGDHASLIQYQSQGKAFDLAIPTPEHYLPLLYTLALQEKNEAVTLYNDKAIAGAFTMTSVMIDKA